MTLLATFHHSHQIDNFSVPRPTASQCTPKISPHAPRKLLSPPGATGCQTPSRNAKDQRGRREEKGRGDGQLSRNGQEGCSGQGVGGRGPGRLRAGSPRLFTRAARGGEPEPGAGGEEAAAVVSSPWRGRDPRPRL